MKKILLITSEFPPQPGGIGNHAYNLASELSGKGYEVTVIADQRDFDNKDEISFDKTLPYKVERIKLRKQRTFMYFQRLSKLFKYIKKNDVVMATGKFSLWSVAFASRFFKRDYLAIIHGTEVNFKGKFNKTLVDASLKRFNKIVAVSRYTKSLVNYLNLKDIKVIPNGIDYKFWDQNKSESVALTGSPKLITVGHVSERKGQLNVIKALPELIKAYPELHYHCIGIPTKAEAFLEEAKTLGVEMHITFHGSMYQDELIKYLKSSDVFIMLSNRTVTGDVEGFGIAVLEANALELPAIGAKDCGIEDAINHEKSGILIKNDDALALKDALKTILDKYSTYQEESKLWAKQHSWNNIITTYIDYIEA